MKTTIAFLIAAIAALLGIELYRAAHQIGQQADLYFEMGVS